MKFITFGSKKKHKVHLVNNDDNMRSHCKFENSSFYHQENTKLLNDSEDREICKVCVAMETFRRKQKLKHKAKVNESKQPVPSGAVKVYSSEQIKAVNFYRSPEWRKLRYEVLVSYEKKCMICGNTDKLHVDHIKPMSKFPELKLDFNNLQILCEDCNMGKGNRCDKDFRPIKT